MNFLKSLFTKETPSEKDILNHALSKINLPYESLEIKELLQRRYPQLSQEEIEQLAAKCTDIFDFCSNTPAYDDTFPKRVGGRFPFLSKKALDSLRGKAFLIQERGAG